MQKFNWFRFVVMCLVGASLLVFPGCVKDDGPAGHKDNIENGQDVPAPKPDVPDPENPDVTDPENPDITDPENPDPDVTDPDNPNPENPDSENPDPEPDPDPNPDPNLNPNPDPDPEPDPEVLPVQPGTAVFARGVSLEKGWYDVNKSPAGQNGDINMCWAAAGANMLQWWIDNYKRAGHALPAGTPEGKGTDYELAIFEIFKEQWDNRQGSQIHFGLRWFLNGDVTELNQYQGIDKPLPQYPGGFLNPDWNFIGQHMSGLYTQDLQGYYLWDSGYEEPRHRLDVFTDYIVEAFKDGMAGLSIRSGYSSLHAITMWGYELDADGRICKAYITDSDDQVSRPASEPRVRKIHEFGVELRGEEIGLVGMYDGFKVITDIFPFRGWSE